MKLQAMLRILFRMLQRRKMSARALAAETGVSERSVYRYVEELIVAGVPLDIIRGRNGGICLPDTYRLPENFFTQEEYAAAVNALHALYEQLPDEALASAIEKLSRQKKADSRSLTFAGNVLVDSGTWGDVYHFSDKLKVLDEAIDRTECLDLTYIDRSGQETRRTVEPHLLVLKQNIWYVYAWCRAREAFRLFRIGRIRAARATGQTFEKRELKREDIPLRFAFGDARLVTLAMEILPPALPDAEEWLGVDNIRTVDGKLIAEANMPQDEVLFSRLLSFGEGVRVLSPQSLADELAARAQAIAAQYRR